jgi:orotate phosphoribosyltransferase
MHDYQTSFIRFMLSAGALRFGDFTTKSGRKTPYFINTGAYRTGEQLAKLGEFYAAAIAREFGDGFDNLFGPAYKGIPLAVTTAIALSRDYGRDHGRDVTVTFNRKEAKDHGEGGVLVGYDYKAWAGAEGAEGGGKPCRVLLIEDVTTAGTSVRESLPLIEAGGQAKAVGLVVSVDRMEKGAGERPALREIREDFGLKTTAIVSVLDLIAYLETPEGADYVSRDASLLDRMRAYRETYGAA